jgi:hypothetical protein
MPPWIGTLMEAHATNRRDLVAAHAKSHDLFKHNLEFLGRFHAANQQLQAYQV